MSLSLATKGVISPSPALSLATKGVLWVQWVLEAVRLILNPTYDSVTLDREIIHLPYEIKPYP